MVKRLVAVISYDGSAFKGYQIQPDSFTIQGEIEKVLKRILQCDVKIYASGRTDRGVHALGQIIHFDVDELPVAHGKFVDGIVYDFFQKYVYPVVGRFSVA